VWAGTFTSLGGQPKSGLLSLSFLHSPAESLLLGVTYDPGSWIMSMTEAAHALEANPETEYQDRSIKCVDCNENFIWTAGEQVFFHDKGLKNEPKRCKPCKQAKNERLAAIAAAQSSGVRQRIEVSVQCAQCGQQTTVPFYPSQGRPVYCRSCFLAGKTAEVTPV
jgi:CxxC-x17-CxxC domain-containing protein